MRRATLSLTSVLMLTACFGAPQGADSLSDGSSIDTREAPVAPSSPAPGGVGEGTVGGGSGGANGTGAPADPREPVPREPDARGTGDDDQDVDDASTDDAGAGAGAGADPDPSSASREVTEKDAARFLMQASFGISRADIASVQLVGYDAWLERQMAMPARSMTERMAPRADRTLHHVPDMFYEFAVEGDDQLRQRVAFALSQIVVASNQEAQLNTYPDAFLTYADILQRNAFGNYEDLIREVSMTPAMGVYLSHLGNEAADPDRGNAADENYAREVMQLFTIGLEELTPGGEPTGRETYTPADVAGLAKVFTGLSWDADRWAARRVDRDVQVRPMRGFPEYHDQGEKTFLGTTLPGGLTPEESVDRALDHLLAHANVGPFVSKQLIQRLVTSNPSPDYVASVAAAYDAGTFAHANRTYGTGRRGDMAAVVAAIYLHPEARDMDAREDARFGRVRSPILRFTHWARTFRDDRGVGPTPEPVGRMRYSDSQKALGQRAFGAPSVFGYSRPGYVAPGSWSANEGLVAPGLTHASGAGMVGFMHSIKNYIEDRHDVAGFFSPDYEDLVSLAAQPEALVDELDLLLTAGAMTDAAKDRVRRAVETIDLDDAREPTDRRVWLAIYMTMITPEYAVQR